MTFKQIYQVLDEVAVLWPSYKTACNTIKKVFEKVEARQKYDRQSL